ANQPKHGATPLEGIVETDWNMAPFTLNWKLTDPATAVRFVEGEPLCTILPIPRGMLASVQPRLAEIHDDPTLFDAYDSWRRSRGEFLRELRKPGSAAQQEKWQRDYFLGRRHDGTSVPDHATRLHLRPFADPAHDGEPAAIAASNTPDADPDSNDDTAKT
ncbi:MAG: hypothetical protein KDA41_10440, partial [Planctomycetales bacterium]|nr:hypothetical protein [Planctomycetales bacterium]